MKPKDIRRLLADARERKQNLMARNIKIDWPKSVFLVSETTFNYLEDYFEATQDTFALRYESPSQIWYLFDVRLLIDGTMPEESPPDLAVVLESNRRW